MASGRPIEFEIALNEAERAELVRVVSSRALPAGVVRRARIVLSAASGQSRTSIAKELAVTAATVHHWRRRFQEYRLAGLYAEARPGRPRTRTEEEVASFVRRILRTKPKAATHWTVRLASKETGISKSTVHRYFELFGLQPHRSKSFSLSQDPLFIEKVRDVVGLYLNPPDKALVLCVDEKSQIQALERTQPVLPIGLGYVEGVTHGYTRHGTTTLFAALNVADGTVLAQCKSQHRHQEFLSFLRHIDRNVPKELDVHLIVDNYATHKHAAVRAWIAKRPRYHLHLTPTYSSWLNQVERWFALLDQRALRRTSFRNVPQVIRAIDSFVQHHNEDPKPFVWTATADSIFEKLARLSKVISGTAY